MTKGNGGHRAGDGGGAALRHLRQAEFAKRKEGKKKLLVNQTCGYLNI